MSQKITRQAKPNRRTFLQAAVGGTMLAGCGAGPMRSGRVAKPNLLFLWTDEQRADTMAAYGNRTIHTPHLNRLAAESVVFEKAYVTQPVCTPSRSSVMTGLWPHQNGCTKNNIPLPEETACFPELVNDPDYRTAYMGKWHLGDEIFAQHGFEEWAAIEDGYARYYRAGRERNRRSDYHHFLVEKGYRPDSKGRFSRNFAARRPLEHCKPKFLEGRACEFLRRHREEPFMLYVNFLEPHMPFFGPLDGEHDPAKVTLPANFDDPLEANEPLRYRVKREGCIEKYGGSEEAMRALIGRYWGLVTQVDRSVGAILRTLEELGLKKNTIVVFSSDHGDMMGSHRLVEKSVMYEESVRVPWLVRAPGMKKRFVRQPVSQIDMAPTLLDLMGRPAEKTLPGQSLVPLMRGGTVAREDVFIEWHPNSGALKVKSGGTKLATKEELKRVENESSRAVITPDGWKLVLSDVEKCQLFNLREDPGERTNLYDSGRHTKTIKRLREKIQRWQASVGDTLKV